MTVLIKGLGFFQIFIKRIQNIPKCYHVTSLVVSVDQINFMMVTNDNTHMVSQRMKSYFVNFIFHLKSMSFTTMITQLARNLMIHPSLVTHSY
jgi:hypothetical protein